MSLTLPLLWINFNCLRPVISVPLYARINRLFAVTGDLFNALSMQYNCPLSYYFHRLTQADSVEFFITAAIAQYRLDHRHTLTAEPKTDFIMLPLLDSTAVLAVYGFVETTHRSVSCAFQVKD